MSIFLIRFEQIDEPSVVCIDWDLNGNDITDMINSLMKPKFIYRAADEPPTSLENMLQAHIEAERMTGANQWRSVHGGAWGCRAHCSYL